jgi:hypothetical protein
LRHFFVAQFLLCMWLSPKDKVAMNPGAVRFNLVLLANRLMFFLDNFNL